MKNYESKMEWLGKKYNWNCPIAKKYDMIAYPTELHHSHIHNIKWARKKYPLYIDSIWNLLPVHNAWHLSHGSFGKWPERMVIRCEDFLQRHKKISEWVNNPEINDVVQ